MLIVMLLIFFQPPASSSTQLTQDDSFAAQLAAKLGKIAPPPIGSNSTIEKNRDEQKSAFHNFTLY